jgi:peptide/nickel transport system permease protein
VGGSRVIRAAVIGVRSAPYLEAARVIGARDGRIMAWHVLPNIFGPWMVQATIALGGIILTESSLSFLGFGVTNPNQPSWGAMLQLGQTVAAEHPMQAVWPGLAIALAVFSFNMLGDALRDLLDPRLRGASGSFH